MQPCSPCASEGHNLIRSAELDPLSQGTLYQTLAKFFIQLSNLRASLTCRNYYCSATLYTSRQRKCQGWLTHAHQTLRLHRPHKLRDKLPTSLTASSLANRYTTTPRLQTVLASSTNSRLCTRRNWHSSITRSWRQHIDVEDASWFLLLFLTGSSSAAQTVDHTLMAAST